MIGSAASSARSSAIGVALGALLAAASPAGADQVTLEPSKDNTIYEEGGRSNGKGSGLFIGVNNMNNTRRALMAFDIVGALPAGSTITSVSLRVVATMGQGGSLTATLNRLEADWGEGSSNAIDPEGKGAPATQGDATWAHRFFNTQLWSSAGGDFATAASATRQIGDMGAMVFESAPGLVADVQTWLDEPASNFGWLLRGNETSSSTAKRLHSRESGTTGSRPKLTIEFLPLGAGGSATATVAPTETPTPSATASATVPSSPTSTSTTTAPPTAEATSTATAIPSPTDTASPTETVAAPTPTPTPTFSPTPTATQPVSTCVGDCDGDGSVSISELIAGVNIALGTQPLSRCPAFDPDGGGVAISDLVTAVNNALDGCP